MYIEGKTKGSTAAAPSEFRGIHNSEVDDTLKSCQSNTLSSQTVQKGIMWLQRDRIFSRWKERYIVLTPDYLNCFRKATDSGNDRISDMGSFMFKIKLVEVDRVELVTKKNCTVIVIHMTSDGRFFLRPNQNIQDWHENLEDCRIKSRKRREMLRISHDSFYIRDRENEGTSTLNSANGLHDDWLLSRTSIGAMHANYLGDSAVDVSSMAASMTSAEDDDKWPITARQRLSMLTSMDMNSIDSPPPSMPPSLRGRTPCRVNSDIFFMVGRQRASIAGTTTSSASRGIGTADPSFKLPNMLHTTRGTANRYSYAEENISSYNPRSKPPLPPRDMFSPVLPA